MIARAGMASRSDSRYSRTKVWLNPRARPQSPAGLSQAWQLWPQCGRMASCESSLGVWPLAGAAHTRPARRRGWSGLRLAWVARLTQDTMSRRSLCHLLNTYRGPGTPYPSLLKAKDGCLPRSE